MSKTISLSMLALSAFMAGVTAFESPAEARRGRNLAIGLGAAAATAIILSETARASEERRYYRRGRISCAELADRCEDGSDWACDKYERRCE